VDRRRAARREQAELRRPDQRKDRCAAHVGAGAVREAELEAEREGRRARRRREEEALRVLVDRLRHAIGGKRDRRQLMSAGDRYVPEEAALVELEGPEELAAAERQVGHDRRREGHRRSGREAYDDQNGSGQRGFRARTTSARTTPHRSHPLPGGEVAILSVGSRCESIEILQALS
jgi:hypothetical protein